jgi:hypothetical protein
MDFKTAINNISNFKQQKKQIDISNWTQYGFKDGKIQCLNPPQELTKEEKQQEIIETLTQISCAIELNRYKYMMKYDELHGEGAYERLYNLKSIYDNLDSDLDLLLDSEEEEVNSDYEQNVYCY